MFSDPENLPMTLDVVTVDVQIPHFLQIVSSNLTILGEAYYQDIGEYKLSIRGVDNNNEFSEDIVKLVIAACHYKCEQCFGEYAYECESCLPGFSYHDFYCLD